MRVLLADKDTVFKKGNGLKRTTAACLAQPALCIIVQGHSLGRRHSGHWNTSVAALRIGLRRYTQYTT